MTDLRSAAVTWRDMLKVETPWQASRLNSQPVTSGLIGKVQLMPDGISAFARLVLGLHANYEIQHSENC